MVNIVLRDFLHIVEILRQKMARLYPALIE